MRTFTTWTGLTEDARGATAAIGNFDGVHLGHQAVIDLAGRAADAPLGVVTFEPHPREVFAPDAPPFRLMSAETKAHRLEKLGVELLYQLNFTPDLFRLTPEQFARDVIHRGLGLNHVVVGRDFCFGKGRAGSSIDLQAFGKDMGFGVTVADLIEKDGVEVSSTSIRKALTEGRPRDAATMLGHWHRIDGDVLHGEKRGRDLGYPTANMSIDGLHPPRFGVYAVKVDVLTGPHRGSYNGAASIGVRPMFGGERCEPGNLHLRLFGRSLRRGSQRRPGGFPAPRDGIRHGPRPDQPDGRRLRPRPRDPARHNMKDPIQRDGLREKFWERVPLKNLAKKEWEALCDGCGKCCLNKLEDPDTGEIAFTRVACRLLDDETCRCAQYDIRKQFVPDCVVLTPGNISKIAYWMPTTCAYRLLYEGKPLAGLAPADLGNARHRAQGGHLGEGLDRAGIRSAGRGLGRPHRRGPL